MHLTTTALFFLALVTRCILAEGDHKAVDVKCGMTGDAKLADCEILLNNEQVFKAKSDIWQIWVYHPVPGQFHISPSLRVACNGACCLYLRKYGGWSGGDTEPETWRSEAQQLLQCASKEEGFKKGLINGVGIFQKGEGQNGENEHAMCLANINTIDSMTRCFEGLPDGY